MCPWVQAPSPLARSQWRSFILRMLAVNTGVDPASTITADMQLPDAAYREWPKVDQFYASLVRALEQRPGIVAAGTTTFLPLQPGWRLP